MFVHAVDLKTPTTTFPSIFFLPMAWKFPLVPIPKQPLIPSVFKIQAKISAWCFLAYIHPSPPPTSISSQTPLLSYCLIATATWKTLANQQQASSNNAKSHTSAPSSFSSSFPSLMCLAACTAAVVGVFTDGCCCETLMSYEVWQNTATSKSAAWKMWRPRLTEILTCNWETKASLDMSILFGTLKESTFIKTNDF